MLVLLTVVTGLVDAISYLRLGHVFVANMTGNVVFLGFGIAGATDVSLLASVLALAGFAAGALAGGRIGLRFGAHRGRLLAITMLVNLAVVACAVALAMVGGTHLNEAMRDILILPLSSAMGLQNAAARRIGVPDLTTTVLTLTITGIAADSRLAGGTQPRPGRRLLAVLAMLLGAAIGGLLVLDAGVAAALTAVFALIAVTCGWALRATSENAPWAASPSP